jgi:hypothetical protein
MLERYIQALSATDVGLEEPAATRERLKDRFPRGATRRMTQLGLLVGAALEELGPGTDHALVYASGYAETRALEGYLDSFPAASPTLFQTSIHPSAVQQALIGRQLPVREFFPLTGRLHLPAHSYAEARSGGPGCSSEMRPASGPLPLRWRSGGSRWARWPACGWSRSTRRCRRWGLRCRNFSTHSVFAGRSTSSPHPACGWR